MLLSSSVMTSSDCGARKPATVPSLLVALIALVACSFAAAPTATATRVVHVRSCQDSNCSSACTASTFPLDQCIGGVEYSCQPSLLECMDVVTYNNSGQTSAGAAAAAASVSCASSEIDGPSSIVCDACTTYVNRYQNGSVFGVFRNCTDNASRAFYYDCDAGCASCRHSIPVGMGACTVNPIDGVHAIVPLRVRPCNQLLTMAFWITGNCSGTPAQEGVVPTDSCLYEGEGASSSYTCAPGP